MFSYTLPCGGFRTITKVKDDSIQFEPRIYEQRYCATVQILGDPRWNNHMKKVVDYGCAELTLLPLLRRVENIEHILEIDIDEKLLNIKKNRADPLIADYLKKRKIPLKIEILLGSISDYSPELSNTDAVIALEVIEHLHDDVLSEVPQNIFGKIQPKLAIFSTPNSEFNVLFHIKHANGFRHEDHKFEWDREQFKSWCLNVTENYQNYEFSIMGVGEPPKGHEHIGYVSQIAIFARKDVLDMPLEQPIVSMDENSWKSSTAYKIIHSVDYPVYVDTRSTEAKVTDEIWYRINRCIASGSYYDEEDYVYKIPISILVEYTEPLGGNLNYIRNLLYKMNIEVKDNMIIRDDTIYNFNGEDVEPDEEDGPDDIDFIPPSYTPDNTIHSEDGWDS